MQKLHKVFNPNATAQNRPLNGTQVKNRAGGYVWELSPEHRLDRFLILGTEGGSYYASAQTLTIDSAKNVVTMLAEDGVAVVQRVVQVSTEGRAYKNDPALFVLALAFTVGDIDTRAAAKDALPQVARTGTHLFTFMEYVNSMRGWGRGLRSAVASWYDTKPLGALAYQVTKYAQRNGWTHRDALRLAHPKTQDRGRDALYSYITGNSDKLTSVKGVDNRDWVDYIAAVEAVKTETDVRKVANAVASYNLPREVLPTDVLKSPEVWDALMQKMPMTAMIRNLATMTRVGLLTPMSQTADMVVARLSDQNRLRKARVHPIQILAALMTYQAGRGVRGSLGRGKGRTWTPVQSVVDALDKAFYLSFQNVKPTNKRIMLALDVSGSMGFSNISAVPSLTPRVASAALAMVTAAREKNHMFTAFSHQMVPLNISPRQRLDSVLKTVSNLPFGATDCALPMQYALAQKLKIDAFVVLTDNETWFGQQHPAQALQVYRQKTGIAAKLVVVGMVANQFSIADPKDAGMLDVVGFSTNTPTVISDFIAEKV